MTQSRAQWEDQYCMVAAGTLSDATFNSSSHGPYGVGNIYVFLNDGATFSPGQNAVVQKKTTGKSYMTRGGSGSTKIERIVTTEAPSTTYNLDIDAKVLALPFATLCQNGSTLTSGGSHTFTPYEDSVVNDSTGYMCALMRVAAESGSENHVIKGAIARQITLSGNEGEAAKMSIEWTGADFAGNVAAPGTTTLSGCSDTIKMFNAVNCYVNSSGNTLDITSFNISITNNAEPKWYNNSTVQKYMLGNFEVSGSVTVSWGDTNLGGATPYTNLASGDDIQLVLYWGDSPSTPDSAGEIVIKLNVEIEDVSTTSDNENMNEISFVGMSDVTNDVFNLQVYDGIDRSSAFS